MGLSNALNLIQKGVARGKEIGFHAAFAYGVRKIHDSPRRMKQAVYDAYSTEDLRHQRETKFPQKIKISILVPLYHTPIPFLEELIRSVQEQTYSNWELCFADGSDTDHAEVGACVMRYAKDDSRIHYRKLAKNEGIAGNSNACISLATGDYIGLLDHDDLLHPAALYEVMKAICDSNADFVYTDEATFQSPDACHIVSIHYKPDYAPDQLRANNYICHFSVFSRHLLKETELFRKEYDGSQDHDLILRLTDKAKRVIHIPKVLYLWRSHPQSVAMSLDAKGYAVDAGIRAVESAAVAAGYPATAEVVPGCGSVYRMHYEVAKKPLVSIIIPQCADGIDAVGAATDLLSHTNYPRLEILLIGGSAVPNNLGIKQISADISSYGEGCKVGAEQAEGEYLLFFNAALRPMNASWLTEMMMYAQRCDVGVVGTMQIFKRKLSHTGYVLGFGKNGIAGCPYLGYPQNYGGYMHCLRYARDVSAVSGSCMLLKKADYDMIANQLDQRFNSALLGIELCLILGKQGLRHVWTPYAVMERIKGEGNPSQKELNLVAVKWCETLEKGDPYYNPNFTHRRSGFLIQKK